jgi:hypothetical protein
MSGALKAMCLDDELNAAYRLIVAGLGDLQEINLGNSFYHLPHQLLASGIERLLKCYICLVYEARNGDFPDDKFVKKLSHDLSNLTDTICRDYFTTTGPPRLQEDFAYITNDALLRRLIHILSEFGKYARYYNLDVVTGSQKLPIDPTAEWQAAESDIEDITAYLKPEAAESLHRDYYPRVHSKMIAKLERFIRAVAMQFTLGNHGGQLLKYSSAFTPFRNLRDEQLGTTDYRRSVRMRQENKDKWIKRTADELQRSPWPTKLIAKASFTGDWPFRASEVVVECREQIFCVVNIDGYDFALNGAASSKYSLPYPHDAGMAIIGKSVGPFIEMARTLSTTK